MATIANRFLGAAVLALMCWLGPLPAYADGPFGNLAGTWSGAGTITLDTGSRERIRCRANYAPSEAGVALRLDLRCASDSFKFELTSNLRSDGGSISGTWSENTRHVSGSITGRASGNTVTVTALSITFTAYLTVNTSGNRQSIAIRSPGSEMKEVSISLSRTSRH